MSLGNKVKLESCGRGEKTHYFAVDAMRKTGAARNMGSCDNAFFL